LSSARPGIRSGSFYGAVGDCAEVDVDGPDASSATGRYGLGVAWGLRPGKASELEMWRSSQNSSPRWVMMMVSQRYRVEHAI